VLQVQHNLGAVGANPYGTVVTTGAAEATKGTVVQLIASTSFDAYWVTVLATQYGLAATDSQGALDILIGAATEEVWIPNLLMGFCSPTDSATGVGPKRWDFPLYLPAGTRIAARAAGKRLSTAMRVSVFLYGGAGLPPFRVGRNVTTLGMGTVPFGTTIVPGASAAEGAWTQVIASTAEDYFCFVPSFQAGTDTTLSRLMFSYDIGMGAATETEMAQGFLFTTTDNEMMRGPENPMPAFFDAPSGSRIVARVSNSGANDAGNYNTVIHAVS
jgi:hypothetical protein